MGKDKALFCRPHPRAKTYVLRVKMWVKTRLYSAARIRGLGFSDCVWQKNLGVDKPLMVELLARLCVYKIGRFYMRYARKWVKNEEQMAKAPKSRALCSPRAYYNSKSDKAHASVRAVEVAVSGATNASIGLKRAAASDPKP